MPRRALLWLSNLVGGLLFGIGMVLASGCGSKTLVRVGGGNLKSLVVLFVLAVAAYATMRGVLAVARVATLDTVAVTLPTGQDLPSLLAHATGASRQSAGAVARRWPGPGCWWPGCCRGPKAAAARCCWPAWASAR